MRKPMLDEDPFFNLDEILDAPTELWDDYDTACFTDEVMEQLPGYDSKTVEQLNKIAEHSFEFSLQVRDILASTASIAGSRALQSMVAYLPDAPIQKSRVVLGLLKKLEKSLPFVLDELDKLDDIRFNTFASYVTKSAEVIEGNYENTQFKAALSSLANATHSFKKVGDPVKHFEQLLSSREARYFTDSEASKKFSYQALSDELKTFLAKLRGNEVENSLDFLAEYPAARFLDVETFTNMQRFVAEGNSRMESEDKNEMKELYFSPATLPAFVKRHAGSGEEKFKFYFKCYKQFDLQRIGKNFMSSIYGRCKGNPSLTRQVLDNILPRVYSAIPQKAKKAPKWMYSLADDVKLTEDFEIIVMKAVGAQQIIKKGKALKNKYRRLVKKLSGNTVLLGKLQIEDYLLDLDHDLLEAMEKHHDSLTDVLAHMGDDLAAANQKYLDSSLTAEFYMALCANGTQVESAREYTPAQRSIMAEISDFRRPNTIRWLARREASENDFKYAYEHRNGYLLEELIPMHENPREYLLGLNEDDLMGLDALLHASVSDRATRKILKLSPPNLLGHFSKINGSVLSMALQHSDDYKKILDYQEELQRVKVAAPHFKDYMGLLFQGTRAEASNRARVFEKIYPHVETSAPHNGQSIANAIRRASLTELKVYEHLGEVMAEISHLTVYSEYVQRIAKVVNRRKVDISELCQYARRASLGADEAEISEMADIVEYPNKEAKDFLQRQWELGGEFGREDLNALIAIPDWQDKKDMMYNLSRKFELPKVFEYVVKYSRGEIVAASSFAGMQFADYNKTFDTALENGTAKYLEKINEKYYQAFVKFATKTPRDKLVKLPVSEFNLAAEAYEFAESNGAVDEFFDAFGDVLEQGNLAKWAQHIIDHFQPKGIGGGNYREVQV